MRRRDIISLLLGATVSPLLAHAQQERVWRIGYLHQGTLNSSSDVALLESFRNELSNLGYIEGKNLVIDWRAAEGHSERLPALASELVSLRPDLIVATSTPAIAAAQQATTMIPIVMTTSTDPVASGFVKSLSHPGGNITGLSNMSGDLTAKTIEFLHAALPSAKKIAVLMTSNPNHPHQYELASAAAQIVGLSTIPILAATPDDLERAFRDAGKADCGAVLVLADAIRPTIVPLAAAARIPAVYQFSDYVVAGGLVSYGPSLAQMWKRSAQYIDKIFRGASPAELPVERPTRFELVINLKTAKALGITIPPSLLDRVDEVIE